jgi:hypothetical protein
LTSVFSSFTPEKFDVLLGVLCLRWNAPKLPGRKSIMSSLGIPVTLARHAAASITEDECSRIGLKNLVNQLTAVLQAITIFVYSTEDKNWCRKGTGPVLHAIEGKEARPACFRHFLNRICEAALLWGALHG